MSRLAGWIAFGCLAVAGAGVDRVAELNNRVEYSHQALNAHETHGASSLLGQFRTSVAAWLWLRTDLYLHNGVEMRPMSKREIAHGVASEAPSEHDHHALGDEEHVVTTVPSAERDFRGILGDIDRAVSTYKPMDRHSHNDPKAAIPLFRLMTAVSPDFVIGWITGASVMARDPRDISVAMDFLERGLAANPKSIAILTEIGRLRTTKLHQLTAAIGAFEEARRIAQSTQPLSEEDVDTLADTYRWLCLCYRNRCQFDRMRSVAIEGLQRFENDPILMRMSKSPPLVLSRESLVRWYSGKPL